ncbi:hypothetical protein KFE25_006121 [Diacronema lutheri]|uniref:mannonate dehydratase n=1 Tax=Diacronema lutheri TaxID=2081491 RepID=A0A8J5XVB9_DIALT|nr:hypothetical protein KFE25_006121 [Diacronema lutheri]
MELRLEQAWRWFGPADPVSLTHIKQAGAMAIVTACHDIAPGEVWPVDAIRRRQAEVEAAGLRWSVVESVPVHESIKLGLSERDVHIAAYQATIRNLGACGLRHLCWNFMPVLDWTRTDLEREWPDGSRALAFDIDEFAAFELHILKREGAEADYPEPVRRRAAARFDAMSAEQRRVLESNVIAGLPGRMVGAYTLDNFKAALEAYRGVGAEQLRANLCHFLRAVVPVAEEAGVLMAIHPDDPPRPLLGLPRVVSTRDDVSQLLGAVDSVHNGLTFCVGSYGSTHANDVEAMATEFAHRVHFLHLRNVSKEGPDGSFVEADHLTGDVDMHAILRTFILERERRVKDGWVDCSIPFRPDHGHRMLDDLDGTKRTNPGYSAIGRLRGLAELRGLQEGIVRSIEGERGLAAKRPRRD